MNSLLAHHGPEFATRASGRERRGSCSGYQIDPRPFLNQLAQAEGAFQRDLAALAGSRRDLKRYEALGTGRARS